jgi:hypothetical protein
VTEPKHRTPSKTIWGKSETSAKGQSETSGSYDDNLTATGKPAEKSPTAQLKLDPKFPNPQSELAFDNAPKGRFEGETPNVFEGEDLDLPPFLRKKKS